MASVGCGRGARVIISTQFTGFSYARSFSPVNPVFSYFVQTECHRAESKPLSACGGEQMKQASVGGQMLILRTDRMDRQDLRHDASLRMNQWVLILFSLHL